MLMCYVNRGDRPELVGHVVQLMCVLFLLTRRNLVPGLSPKRSELHAGREHVRPFGRKCDHAAP